MSSPRARWLMATRRAVARPGRRNLPGGDVLRTTTHTSERSGERTSVLAERHQGIHSAVRGGEIVRTGWRRLHRASRS